MRRLGRWLLLLIPVWPALAQEAKVAHKVPPGGEAALACGQGPDGRTYWTEYAFCDLAVKGPSKAKGLVFWSHGVHGTNEQYVFPAPPVVRRFAEAGWDVIRINRNNLRERNWVTSGVRHREDLIERVRAARSQGYRRIILAGQSYGGAISLEANAKVAVDGVLALSAGHGSDATTHSGAATYANLDGYLIEAVERQKGGRVVISVPADDLHHPNRRPGSYIGPKVIKAMEHTGLPFAVFDETMPIRGHGAATTNQFNAWFGACVLRFLDPEAAAPPGRTTCPAPDPVPAFLLPANVKRPARAATGSGRWLGQWVGAYEQTGMEVSVLVESISGDTARVIYATGAGPAKTSNMGWSRYTAKLDGETLRLDRGAHRLVEMRLVPDGRGITLQHRSAETAALTAALRPAD